ncbi:MAG: polyprenyl diphosphate synthase [Thermoleophilia bacterium]|nr:polyprenyl diphosphate synthase [Thermoleophilia bacterium]
MGLLTRLMDLRGRGRGDSFFDGERLPLGRVPVHVAVIMDGNGRWAARRHLGVLAGHRAGTRALRATVKAALRAGVRQLTIYSFSTENWSRPRDEVEGLMDLLGEMIDTEVPELDEQGVRVVFVGRRDELGAGLQAKLAAAEERTRDNSTMTLYVAFNYGGRGEIVDAVRAALAEGVCPEELTEEVVAAHMYAPDMREPDLIIRTSGERRLSNFLLWESAYSELYFSHLLWPDFDEAEFARALRDYASRERRFGGRGGRDLA